MKNNTFAASREQKYPFCISVTKNSPFDPRPTTVHNWTFVRVPFEEFALWMFPTEQELNQFKKKFIDYSELFS